MKLSNERKGELFIFCESSLWALFPVITVLSYDNIPPLYSLAFSTLFAAIFFAIILTFKNKWYELKNISAVKDILLATFFIGILYYLFIFIGLRYTNAGNVGIISKAEILFSFLLFNVWKKDYLPPQHILGAVLMIIAAMIILYPNISEFRLGDIIILIAAAFPPFGNFFTRKARINVTSESIMFVRSLISCLVVFLIAIISNSSFSYTGIKNSLIFFIINGVFLLGLSKLFWIEGIHRISVVKANAMGSISPLLTLLFAWIFLHNIPTIWQISSFIPMFFGIILLSINNTNKR